MADLLLDITIFDDYLKGDPGAGVIVQQIIDGTLTASVSPLTVFVLWRSRVLSRKDEIGITALLSLLEEAELSAEVAKVAALLLDSAGNTETEIRLHCAVIAATAQQRGEQICTRDADFLRRLYSKIVTY